MAVVLQRTYCGNSECWNYCDPGPIVFSAVIGATMILLRKRQRKRWRSNFDAIPDKIASEYFNQDDYKKCALKERGSMFL